MKVNYDSRNNFYEIFNFFKMKKIMRTCRIDVKLLRKPSFAQNRVLVEKKVIGK